MQRNQNLLGSQFSCDVMMDDEIVLIKSQNIFSGDKITDRVEILGLVISRVGSYFICGQHHSWSLCLDQ